MACVTPPSTRMDVPVTQLLSGDARNIAAFAMSSTSPRRRSGVRAMRTAILSGSTLPFMPSVGTEPGHTALTRMPRGPRSTAEERVSPSTPALTPP